MRCWRVKVRGFMGWDCHQVGEWSRRDVRIEIPGQSTAMFSAETSMLLEIRQEIGRCGHMNTATVAKPMGRPSEYTQEKADELCLAIADGMSMRKACDYSGITMQTAFVWLRTFPKFQEQYTRATEERTELQAEDMQDKMEKPLPVDEHGRIDPAAVNLLRLQIDTMKWIASKMKPKKYGDKITQEHSGPNGQPIQVMTGVPHSPAIMDSAHVEALPQPMMLDVPVITHDVENEE